MASDIPSAPPGGPAPPIRPRGQAQGNAAPAQLLPAVQAGALRGFMAQVARAQNKSIDAVLRGEINPLPGFRGTYAPLTATELAPIKEALKSGPYPVHGPGKVELYSFEYWFNYFYKELPDARVLEFAVNVINDDGSFRSANQVPNKTQLFDQMLALGFRKFQAADHWSAEAIRVHAARDNPLQANVNILFRGDGRAWQTIRIQGTSPQTQVAGLRASRSMNEDWHPFRNSGNAVWVRNGEVNKDNCLFSAVSVTPQFHVATKFPLLEGLLGESPDQVGHAIVVVRDRPQAQGNVAAAQPLSAFQLARQAFSQPVASGGERTEILAASKTNIYAVVMRGAYNTQLYQLDAPFPEYASDNLEWSDHLVWFAITRIHFDRANANDGHLIVVDDYKVLQSEMVIRAALMGPGSWAGLNAFVSDIVTRGRLRGGVGGIVYTPPGVAPPPFEIVRIRESFVVGRPPPSAPRPAPIAPGAPAPGRVAIPDAFRR